MSVEIVVLAQLDGDLSLDPGFHSRMLVFIEEAASSEPIDYPFLLALLREDVA